MLTASNGLPYPFGVTWQGSGYNFAIHIKNASSVILVLQFPDSSTELPIPLDPIKNKTGNVWHIFIKTQSQVVLYQYITTFEGSLDNTLSNDQSYYIVDPYARLIQSGHIFGHNTWQSNRTPFAIAWIDTFDWEQDISPNIPLENLIIYEMHVRGFTQHPSSKVHCPGTFLGIIEKIPYLKHLGVNAIELLPVTEWDETEYTLDNPLTRKKLCNYWGYSPLNFFALTQRYGTGKSLTSVADEFRTLIKELHKADIEVILDVVFNHTGEGNEKGKAVSWKLLDNSAYYHLDQQGDYKNYSGCGNTFNCNHPLAADQIIDSLRSWVKDYHIDGFRFDLASILARDSQGNPIPHAPIIERISQDPVLANCKLIAEPWDAVGLYQVGNFYPQSMRWSEWNADYRDAVRRFIKGTSGNIGKFATKICGSQDLYNQLSPLVSVNYITCHDGFTLQDLVSYNQKHNEANGEQNRDGMSSNESWNCGVEGEIHLVHVLELRERQLKNYLVSLFVSAGIPMLHMGDEYGHSKLGNNNTWCQDNELNWFLWNQLHSRERLFRFTSRLIQLRKSHPILRPNAFLLPKDIQWHGIVPEKPDWDPQSQFIAYTLKDHAKHEDLYIAFNASDHSVTLTLPILETTRKWIWICNTGKAFPDDIISEEETFCVNKAQIKLIPYSSIILKAKTI